MNSPVTHSQNFCAGQDDDAPLWDQIQPFFAYSDLAGEQPISNEPATSGSGQVGGEFVHADLQLKKALPVKQESRNEFVLRGVSLSRGNYLSKHSMLPPDRISKSPNAFPSLPIAERIGIFGLVVVGVVSVIILLVNYEESIHDSVLPSSALVAQRADPLPSVRAAPTSGPPAVSSPAVPSPAVPSAALSSPAVPSPALSSPAVPAPAASALNELATGLADDEISTLMKRGQDLLKAGDFAAARLLFRRAADAGNAQAALALASTYDPAVIGRLGAVAVSPDIDRALTWYATAADHGSVEAAERYANLARARSARVDEMIK